MSLKKSIEDRLKQRGTEEVKPGFFIQKSGKGYRKITPLVWKGKWRFKEQFSLKNLVWPFILLFILLGYFSTTGGYIEFYDVVHEDPYGFCEEVYLTLQTPDCTEQFEKFGLCNRNTGIDQSNIVKTFEEGLNATT